MQLQLRNNLAYFWRCIPSWQDDTVYFVGEFIDGLTLTDWLTGCQLASREAAQLCVKMLARCITQGVMAS